MDKPPSAYGPGGDQTNQAHRSRLEMMQQERIVDPNMKLKRYHWRAVMTPVMMKYWVPLFAVFGCTFLLSNRLNQEARDQRAKQLVCIKDWHKYIIDFIVMQIYIG